MPRPKGAKNRQKSRQPEYDPRIEEVYETIMEYDCPKRGRVKQKVLVKRVKPPADVALYQVSASDPIKELKLDGDGLETYGDVEE